MDGTSAVSEKHRLRPSPPLITSKILNFPLRRRRRRRLPASPVKYRVTRKLSCDERRRRVKKEDAVKIQGLSGIEVEKWRFQAEALTAESNFLRMEQQFAPKKLEKKTLKSAGKNSIFEGQGANAFLEKETEHLKQKLEELQKSSRNNGIRVHSCSNFDKKAYTLQHKLVELSKKQLPEGRFLEEATRFSNQKPKILSIDEFVKERSSISSRATSISAVDCSRQLVQVIAETEQWSQIQGMLDRVRGEMEQLQFSRDYWENRARGSIQEVQLLRLLVDQWRNRALHNENKAKQPQLELKSKKFGSNTGNETSESVSQLKQILTEKHVMMNDDFDTPKPDENKENKEKIAVRGKKFIKTGNDMALKDIRNASAVKRS